MSPEGIGIPVKTDSSGHFLFISEILNRAVLAASGGTIGKLHDLKVRLDEPFPPIVGLAVRKRRGKKIFEIEWSAVERMDTATIRLADGAEAALRPLETAADEIWLRDELLDKQVVDTSGAKIERVNDIHLLSVNRDLRVVHVDFGWRGLLRRLGWLRVVDKVNLWLFDYRSEEKIISWKYVQPLLSDPDKKNLKLNVAARGLRTLHPSDLADILEELDRTNRSSLFRSLDLQTAAQTLEEVEDPKLQISLIESAPVERASDILEEMAPDEATDLLAELPEEQKDRLVRTMEKPSADTLTALLKFKEGTAGSIMTKDFFAVSDDTTIGQAIEEFRETTYPLESVAYIYVTSGEGRLRGVATLRHLIIGDLGAPIGKFMNERLVTVGPQDDVEDVAAIFKKYKFLAVPVVNEDGMIEGLITLKDIMESQLDE
ncbi:MAG: CBS domain-containing protein [Candidatus Aminicenantes bacterium]|nr:CBS domain-containing protein [Candidatus Aminicenantes bacterium]